MKRFKKLLLLIVILPLTFILSGCVFSKPYVVDIEKTGSNNGTDTYTIRYSNGSKETFSVENGKNGADGQNLTLDSIQEYCEQNDISFDEFLDKYLDIYLNEGSVKTATNIAMQSAVSIFAEHPVQASASSKSPAMFCGSGVIYQMHDDYSYIITNYHVLQHDESLNEDKISNEIHIFQYGVQQAVYEEKLTTYTYDYTYGDGAVKCEYIGGSHKYDLAIIKAPTIQLLANNQTAAAATVNLNYSLSDNVIAAGNPKGYGLSATEGIISVVSESIELYDDSGLVYTPYRVMRVDAAVNGGNSGGGLFNNKGELIGIVNAKIISNDVDNMAYAIPCNNAIKVADNIIYYHETASATSPKQLVLGLSYYEKNHTSVYNKNDDEIYLYSNCVVAAAPEQDTIAYKAGFKLDDIVESVTIKRGTNEITTEFNQAYQVPDFTLTVRAGDIVTFKVKRNGSELTLNSITVKSSDLINCDQTSYKKTARS